MHFDCVTEHTSVPVKYSSLLTLRKNHVSPLEHKTFNAILINGNRTLKIEFEI